MNPSKGTQFDEMITDIANQRKKLIPLFKQLANKFHEQSRQLKIAKTSFASGGVAGGIVSIVGLALIPVTFGASLLVSGVGLGIVAASGTGGVSSVIAEKIIIKKLWKRVNAELEMQFAMEQRLCELIERAGEGGAHNGGTSRETFRGVSIGTSTSAIVAGTMVGTLGKFARVVFMVAGMAYDIYTIANNAMKMHKDSPCEAEETLLALITKLESE